MSHAGGLGECKKIAAIAEGYYAQMAPHVWGGPVITAAALQIAASVPNFLIMEHLEADPSLHVYHYAPYEPSHFKQLMGRYNTRQDEVDQLLRWSVAIKAAAFALPGASERIAEEQERDPSDRGQRAAIRAEVSQPDAEVKAQAWSRINGEGYGSDYRTRAAIAGFQWSHQRDLLDGSGGPSDLARFGRDDRVFGQLQSGGHRPRTRTDHALHRGGLIHEVLDAFSCFGDLPLDLRALEQLIASGVDSGPEPSRDGSVSIAVGNTEMGQGAHTGLAQIAAEELEVPLDRLEVIHASTRQAENKYRGTFGSIAIASLYGPMRQAAATMREMLRTEASARLGVAPEQLVARDGRFELIGDSSRAIPYSELVQGNPRWQMPKTPVPLKSPDQFKVIGRSLPRVDAPAKVTGRAVYGQDARLEGVLHGAVVRPPTIEARMLSARAGKAQSMPGVVKVVIEKGFAGVVARSRAQARAARDAIEVTWDKGRLWQQSDLDALVTVGETHGVNILRKGRARSMLAESTTLSVEYRTGLVAHASLETQSALAVVTESGAKVWTSTQFESLAARQVAKALGIKAKQVEVVPTFLGGGFGGKEGGSAAVEAARLSRATNAPVHVSWDREEAFRNSYVRPMTHHQLAARLNDGRIGALEWCQASGDSVLGLVPGFLARVIGYDPGAASGAWIYYDIPHRDITVWRRPMPLLTGQWRGLGFMPNSFAIESFIDEAAHAAGRDPLQFRLDHLPDDADGRRMATVLNAAAERAGWVEAAPVGRHQVDRLFPLGFSLLPEPAGGSGDRDRQDGAQDG